MTDVTTPTDAAVEAAVVAMWGKYANARSDLRGWMRDVLAAALPHLREQIADEILAELIATPQRYIGSTTAALGYVDGLKVAERVARGGAS